MRVLFVHSGNMYGGVEAMLTTLARNRDFCTAMEQHFALCFDGRLRDELLEAGAFVHDLGHTRMRQPVSVWRARKAFQDLVLRILPDSVICQSSWSQALFGPVVRSLDLPLMNWVHGATSGNHWLERLGRRTVASLNICNSEFTATAVRRLSPLTPAEVIYCPVPPPSKTFSRADRASTRRELDTPEDSVVIIQASRMEPWKGHASLLQALGNLKDSPRWICWIVGGAQRPSEFEYAKRLKAAAAQLGISNRVRFAGQRTDVERLLAAADIHCQPNIDPEPFGIAFVEALYAGLPVVTTAIGGAREIVDEACGILVPRQNKTALAEALRHLIEDEIERTRLGSLGPARAVTLCDPAQQMRKLEQVLFSVARKELAA